MAADRNEATLPLLAPDEPPAFELVNVQGQSSVVLICDHASNRVPQSLGNLGLDSAQLASHIAWDPGAANVARSLSAQLDAPLVLSAYSRLVIDCNRPLQSAESIAAQSAGVPVPGNLEISLAQRQSRIHSLYEPYHAAIDHLLAGRAKKTRLLLSIHSFTPTWDGHMRPWHIGISGWRETSYAAQLIAALARNDDIVVGDKQPYPIEDNIDYTIPMHGDVHGIPSVMIEIRQDGIASREGVASWASRLVQACRLIEAST